MNNSILMALKRKGPAFPKFKSGTLTRRFISLPEERGPRRKSETRPGEKKLVDWRPEVKQRWEILATKHDEKTTWHLMRVKFGLKVVFFFAEHFRSKYSTLREVKMAMHAMEVHHLKTINPKMDDATASHEAVQFLQKLGF